MKNKSTREALLNGECRIFIIFFHIYTLLVWILVISEIWTNGSFVVPSGLTGVYVAFLATYTVRKELLRWGLNENYKKYGELWVVLWLFSGLIIFVLKGFYPDTVHIPGTDVATILGAVTTMFAGSNLSKNAYNKKRK